MDFSRGSPWLAWSDRASGHGVPELRSHESARPSPGRAMQPSGRDVARRAVFASQIVVGIVIWLAIVVTKWRFILARGRPMWLLLAFAVASPRG